MTRLRKLAEELGIAQAQETRQLRRPSEDTVLHELLEMHDAFGGEEILFGSTTAQPALLGHRKLRHPSCNLDYAASMQGIRNMYSKLGSEVQISYDPRDFLSFEHGGMRIQCFYDNIFGWRGGPQFKKESQIMYIEGTPMRVAAQEYTIMLKLRKAEETRQEKGLSEDEAAKVLSGKDRQDIFMLLLSPYFRPDLEHVNNQKIADLCYENVSQDPRIIASFFRALATEQSSLSEKEREQFHDVAGKKLSNAFSDRYLRGLFPGV